MQPGLRLNAKRENGVQKSRGVCIGYWFRNRVKGCGLKDGPALRAMYDVPWRSRSRLDSALQLLPAPPSFLGSLLLNLVELRLPDLALAFQPLPALVDTSPQPFCTAPASRAASLPESVPGKSNIEVHAAAADS